jgi:hypothetical protein
MTIITEQTKTVMRAIENGADIYGYGDAVILRQLAKESPEMVEITRAKMYKGDGTTQMPYFGAMLTHAGKAAIAD